MGFRTDATATIWDIRLFDKYTLVQISTSKKNKKTEKWETDFSGWARFIGKAHTNAKTLAKGDRIKITQNDVSSYFDATKKEANFVFAVFDFDVVFKKDGTPVNVPSQNSGFIDIGGIDIDGMPFN